VVAFDIALSTCLQSRTPVCDFLLSLKLNGFDLVVSAEVNRARLCTREEIVGQGIPHSSSQHATVLCESQFLQVPIIKSCEAPLARSRVRFGNPSDTLAKAGGPFLRQAEVFIGQLE
jgi:hypothetical protein